MNIKINKKIINFGETEIEKHKFHHHESPISTYDVDDNKILVSNKDSFGKKGFEYFIGCQNGKQVRPLMWQKKIGINFSKVKTTF